MFSRETCLVIRRQRQPSKLTPLGICMCACPCDFIPKVSHTFTFSELNIPILISMIANKCNIVWTMKPGIEI